MQFMTVPHNVDVFLVGMRGLTACVTVHGAMAHHPATAHFSPHLMFVRARSRKTLKEFAAAHTRAAGSGHKSHEDQDSTYKSTGLENHVCTLL
jgi:hypothetical protein